MVILIINRCFLKDNLGKTKDNKSSIIPSVTTAVNILFFDLNIVYNLNK